MAWEAGGRPYAESGRDVLVLSRLGDGWRVVWRTQIPDSVVPASASAQ